ncbi:GH25 family lysozyme [Lactobacillus gallinarum]|uniref:GH25 family lysozyme n=1 Tax=Lactobacillus gallinarum TaxID=52242 RepID=UPI000B3665AD|nr:GH25 family lysozyme [Lactobacillus gallinarum]OUQ48185.1 lysin [Lactobacillus gallinarum]
MPRILGVDVANYQPESLAAYYSTGAKYVIIKLTEGLGYLNPKSRGQIKSAHAHHMYVHAYHFATFSHSVSQAKAEAKHFVARAETLNINENRYLWLDWEPGDGNSVVSGTKNQNTKAIIAFMTVIKQAGYKTGLYASSSILRSYVDTAEVIKQFGTCLWVASYPTAGATNKPNFNYFPSMDGVAIWQFTDNWQGLNVDGDVALIDLEKSHADETSVNKVAVKTQPKPAEKIPKIVYAPILYNNPRYMINLRDGNGHATDKYIQTNTRWRVVTTKTIKGQKYYCLGTDKQWVPAKFLQVVK